MEWYEKIKNRRENLGMSQDELAKKLGYRSRSTIAKIESGKNDIPQSKIQAFANALDTTPSELFSVDVEQDKTQNINKKTVFIPVVGKVAAGMPIKALENIENYIEIPADMARNGDYFALKIQGDSMEPKISVNDIVIVKQQSDIESGSIAVVLINGEDSTIKKISKLDTGIMLISNNPAYEPRFFSNKEIEELPVIILGKVVELRAKL